MGAIDDVYCLSDDGDAAFPPQVSSALKPEEKELIVMVVFHNRKNHALNFCMLLESKHNRDAFKKAMTTLCMYTSMCSINASDVDNANFVAHQQISAGFFMRAIGLDINHHKTSNTQCLFFPTLPRMEVAPYLKTYNYDAIDDLNWCSSSEFCSDT